MPVSLPAPVSPRVRAFVRVFARAAVFALLSFVAPAFAPGAAAQSRLAIPAPTGLVNDFARVLSAEHRARVEAIARQVRERSRGEIAVVTLADIGPREAGDVALQIGREWKVGLNAQVGDSARNTGVVVLLVPKETSSDGRGKFFVSTGQGTEGFLTDAEVGAIRRESLGQRQARAYGDALELTTVRLAQAYAKEFGFVLDSAGAFAQARTPDEYGPSGGRGPPRPRAQGGISPVVLLVLFVIVFLVLSSMAGRGRRRGCGGCIPLIIPFPGGGGYGGGWSSGGWGSGGGWGGGGGGGGGFGGFGGGGGFSGGGSGDSW